MNVTEKRSAKLQTRQLPTLVGKASSLSMGSMGFKSRLVQTSDLNICTPMASQTAVYHYIGSLLGLVCPVSVCRDWERQQVLSATANSVWQHVQLSKQTRPRNTHCMLQEQLSVKNTTYTVTVTGGTHSD